MPEKVVVTDYNFDDVHIEREIIEGAGADFEEINAADPEDVIKRAQGATALINQYVPLTEEVFAALSEVEMVARYGIGVDGIDIEAATEHDVIIANIPEYCVDEVSAHTFALILSCIRRIPKCHNDVMNGGWDWKTSVPIRRAADQTLGLVAFGKIARAVAEKARGFNFDILSYDPYVNAEEMREVGVKKVEFEELLRRSDIVSTHTPLTNETEELFDKEAFERMSEDAVFVNTSRGGTVDHAALYDALAVGEIDSAGLDVLYKEPPGDSPLFELDNVVVTPHMAWYSEQSIEDLQRTTAEEVTRIIQDETPRNIVNDTVVQ